MKRFGYVFQVTWTCPACGNPLPINGFTETAHCHRCGEDMNTPLEFWKERFGAEELAEARRCEHGSAQTCTVLGSSWGQGQTAYGHRLPRCQSCKGDEFTDEQLKAASGSGGMDCPGCGERVRVRTPDALIAALIPHAAYAVGEGATGKASGQTPAGTRPVLFQCMKCAGALEVDGSSRVITCSFCDASNYLPDDLWLRLHPVVKARPYFVVAHLPEPAKARPRPPAPTTEPQQPSPPSKATAPITQPNATPPSSEDTKRWNISTLLLAAVALGLAGLMSYLENCG